MSEKIFEALLEEACRQWCEFIDDAPERKDGTGFANFYKEIVADKGKEYEQQFDVKQEEFFGTVGWSEDDLWGAFELCDVEPTEEKVKKLCEFCKSDRFIEPLSSHGWDKIYEWINEQEAKR